MCQIGVYAQAPGGMCDANNEDIYCYAPNRGGRSTEKMFGAFPHQL